MKDLTSLLQNWRQKARMLGTFLWNITLFWSVQVLRETRVTIIIINNIFATKFINFSSYQFYPLCNHFTAQAQSMIHSWNFFTLLFYPWIHRRNTMKKENSKFAHLLSFKIIKIKVQINEFSLLLYVFSEPFKSKELKCQITAYYK